MPKTLSRDEYLQILGLLALARAHHERLEEITLALHQLTGEAGDADSGHCADAVWNTPAGDADELLRQLGVAVEAEDFPP